MSELSSIEISGYKSIRSFSAPLEIKRINVLIGANGAGKSNFISFLRMMTYMTTGALQEYIAVNGYANSILHYGAKNTQSLNCSLRFINNSLSLLSNNTTGVYEIQFNVAAPDTLVFAREHIELRQEGHHPPSDFWLGAGHLESKLLEMHKDDVRIQDLRALIVGTHFFQFHDTSTGAMVRRAGDIREIQSLRKDAGNLASYLLMMRNYKVEHYNRIVDAIRLAFPYFQDFWLEPPPFSKNSILLNWREKSADYVFGPHQLSDGMLRFMALATLFLQPEELMPKLIVIDEPELGLHPHAISLLGGMIKQASMTSQVVLATQSVSLLNQFEPGDVIVVDRATNPETNKAESTFGRLDEDSLKDWLSEYTLGELWQKNIIGGRPSR